MFDGLSTELMGAAIYDLGKAIIDRGSKTEWVQTTLKKWNLAGEQHDFAARYLETLVEIRTLGKSEATLNLFREEDIRRSFFVYYYGSPGKRGNEMVHEQALNLCIEALRVGDEVKAAGVDVEAEVQNFWQVFRQKVQESRTVKEVELMQKIDDLKAVSENSESLLHQIDQWLRQKNTENIELNGSLQGIHSNIVRQALAQQAEKIFNIAKIETAVFNIHLNRAIPRHLTPDPFLPEIFLGREIELQTIHDKLFAPNGNLLLLVNGEGGVGKTSLASKYYREYASEYAHLAWVLSESSIAGALLLLALPLGLKFDERMDAEERFQLLLQTLTNLQKPCLLVIDNANELSDLEDNYQRLRQLPNFHLLLTTRITTFQQAATHRIEGLPEAEALALFQQYYPQFQPQTEKLVFKAIREAVGGNTLVVELLAKNLALLNTGLKTRYALPDLLADLQSKGLLQLSQTKTVTTDYQSPGALRHADPTDIIAAMYELGGLPTEEVALLYVFAVLPAESIAFSTLERLLPDAGNLDVHLLSLSQKGWIENKETTDFKCSPVVQEVVKSKTADLLGDCRGLVKALIRELDSEILHLDNYLHSTLFARYAETVLFVLKQNDDDLGTLCQNTGWYHTDTGDMSKAMLAYQKMGEIQGVLVSENPDNPDFKNGLAISYSKLGETHSALGNLPQALTFFEDDIALTKELHEAYPQNVDFKNGLAVSYSKLGTFYRDKRADNKKAKPYFEQCFTLLKELSEAYPAYAEFKNNYEEAKNTLEGF